MPTISWQDPAGQTLSVEFDATIGENHEDTVTITDYPVEGGGTASDHAQDDPSRLTLEGVVTNVPLSRVSGVESTTLELNAPFATDPGTQKITFDIPASKITPSVGGLVSAGISALKGAVPVKATARGKTKYARETIRAKALAYTDPSRNRPKEVYDLLLDAKSSHALITVHTSIRDYENLLISRLAVPRSAEEGQKVRFQIDFRQVTFADSETVEAPVPVEARGATKKNAGAQAPTDKPASSEDEAEARRSTLHYLLYR